MLLDHALHPADRQSFINAMALVATTVSIVTTDGAAGRDGMAVTAMSSVSADAAQPTLLICINAASRPAPVILDNGVFCVNVLAEDQSMLCDCFAGRHGGTCDQWFTRGTWSRLASTAPALDQALVNFDCAVTEVSRMGSHHVIFGAVQAIRSRPADRPLLHANRAYCRLAG
jgi:flavin reductase